MNHHGGLVRKRAAVLSIFGLILVISACSDSEGAPEPAPTVSTSSVSPDPDAIEAEAEPEAEPLAPGTVVVEREHLNIPVRLEIAPVQVRDGVALLSVDYSLGENAPEDASIVVSGLLAPPSGPMGVSKVRLIDVESGTVHLIGRDSKKQPATTREVLRTTTDKSTHSDGFYSAPQGQNVDVLFPYLGLVEGIPVVEAADGFDLSPVDLGRKGEITYESVPVDAFVAAYDESSSSRVTGKDAVLSLSSDVLFEVDEFKLTKAASKRVDAAAEEMLKVAEVGQVSIVGHTDDVGSADYNQKLSVKRAKSVAKRLSKTLGSDFTLTPEGRGKTDPAVEGIGEEAREANRRVEIGFQAKKSGATVDVGSSGVSVPKALGVVGTFDESVTVTSSFGDEFSVGVDSVHRRGSFLVGTLRVTVEDGEPGPMVGLFGDYVQGLKIDRGLGNLTKGAGAHNVTLLTDGSRVYPSDYVVEHARKGLKDRRSILADDFLNATLKQGEAVSVTVLWPDPGGDTVTIDVPEQFRFTDVPVTPVS